VIEPVEITSRVTEPCLRVIEPVEITCTAVVMDGSLAVCRVQTVHSACKAGLDRLDGP